MLPVTPLLCVHRPEKDNSPQTEVFPAIRYKALDYVFEVSLFILPGVFL